MSDDPSIEKMVRVFQKIRDRRDEIRQAYTAEDQQLEAQQQQIKAALLDHCRENNIESARTESGTFFRQLKQRYWADDWEAMHRFVVQNEVPEFLEKRLNQGVVKQYLEENPDSVPPGLNVNSEYQITIRKPTRKS